jgi:protease-4
VLLTSFALVLGCRQAVRQRVLIPSFVGSSPSIPAILLKFMPPFVFKISSKLKQIVDLVKNRTISISKPKIKKTKKVKIKAKNCNITGSGYRDRAILLAFVSELKAKLAFWKLSFFAICFALIFLLGVTTVFTTKSFIAKITIEGAIATDAKINKAISELKNNNKIAAVIFNINSPGGTITGSESLYLTIKELCLKKQCVATIEDLGASGAYLASLGTGYIIAKNTSLVGSIGVIMNSWNAEELVKKIGLKSVKFKTSKFKAAPSGLEEPDEEVKAYIQSLINDGFEYFTSIVRQSRGDRLKNQEEAFSGKVFSGRQALAIGLVDEIGGEAEALRYFAGKSKSLANLSVKDINLTEDEKKDSLLNRLIGRAASLATTASLKSIKQANNNNIAELNF